MTIYVPVRGDEKDEKPNEVAFVLVPHFDPERSTPEAGWHRYPLDLGRGERQLENPDRRCPRQASQRPFRALSATQGATWRREITPSGVIYRGIRHWLHRFIGPVETPRRPLAPYCANGFIPRTPALSRGNHGR